MSIRLEIANSVARVTIDRPEVLNALDADAEQALEAIWQQLEADRDVRAVVLTGAGERAFCAGADMKSVGRSGLEYWAMARPAGFGGIALRTTLDIPVIARNDNGAQARMSLSQRSTAVSSSACGTTWLTRPIASASAAEKRRPVSSTPIAWRNATWR